MAKKYYLYLFLFIISFGIVAYFLTDGKNHVTFAKKFVMSPETIGAIAPSSRFLAKEITSQLALRGNKPIRVLEVGAGTGEFTEIIVSFLRPNDRLDIIEIEQEFCQKLESLITSTGSNSLAQVHCLSVLDWKSDEPYDYIISGLPFNAFRGELVEQIIEHYMSLTKHGTIISYFEYPLARTLREAYLALRNKQKELINFERVKKALYDLRNKFSIQKKEVYINVPPARVYHIEVSRD